MIGKNKILVILNFLDTHYGDLVCSPKNLYYHKEGEIYFRFNLKDEVIFLEYKNFIQPICKALNIKEDMLNDLYEVIKEWIEYVFKIKGTIM
jgi:hypothetical protein